MLHGLMLTYPVHQAADILFVAEEIGSRVGTSGIVATAAAEMILSVEPSARSARTSAGLEPPLEAVLAALDPGALREIRRVGGRLA